MSSLTSTYKVGKGVFTPTTLGSDDTLLIIKPGKRPNVKTKQIQIKHNGHLIRRLL